MKRLSLKENDKTTNLAQYNINTYCSFDISIRNILDKKYFSKIVK